LRHRLIAAKGDGRLLIGHFGSWRIWLEPRRLFWRYLTTNPRALYLLLNRSRSTDIGRTQNQ
jgi:hypothetical protein